MEALRGSRMQQEMGVFRRLFVVFASVEALIQTAGRLRAPNPLTHGAGGEAAGGGPAPPLRRLGVHAEEMLHGPSSSEMMRTGSYVFHQYLLPRAIQKLYG
ncbi:hypothetical protein EYF80_013803 [Liparis tanakae]|uniref:Uncharacterized protein n=1 Tax=Liparis tanakae TaxID=230148 RepID=A0A4Z2IDJ7_9TELE|nr:hypothetical protein EYF80_013803 [Liparis tanakae]